MAIEYPLLSAHGYQLLSWATSYFVGDNRDNSMFQTYFEVFHSLLVMEDARLIIEWDSMEGLDWMRYLSFKIKGSLKA